MKALAIAVCCLWLGGCYFGPTLPKDQVFRQTKECEAHGLRAVAIVAPDGYVKGIQCVPLADKLELDVKAHP
jgi:hypothetical protein